MTTTVATKAVATESSTAPSAPEPDVATAIVSATPADEPR